MIPEEAVTLTASDGVRLEARVATASAGAPPAGIVVCHPHPLYGGDMDNPIVLRAAETAVALGLSAMRFNFRGVGRSAGVHGGGEAESQDVRAALAHLRDGMGPAARLVLAGYSFGATVAARVAAAVPVDGLALIAPPLGLAGDRMPAGIGDDVAVLAIVGSADAYCPAAALDRLRVAAPQATIEVIEGADHFFFGGLDALGAALERWLRGLLASSVPRQPLGRRRTG